MLVARVATLNVTHHVRLTVNSGNRLVYLLCAWSCILLITSLLQLDNQYLSIQLVGIANELT